MIMLTDTEALLVEEVLEDAVNSVMAEEVPENLGELIEALGVIRACTSYSEEEMLEVDDE